MRTLTHAVPGVAVLVLALSGAPAVPASPAADPPGRHVLFSDDFASLDRWESDRDGVWTVARHVARGRLSGAKQARAFLFAGDEGWTDYAVDLDLCQVRGVDKGVVVCVTGKHGIAVDLRGGDYQDVRVYHQEIPLGNAPAPNADHHWQHLRVEVRGGMIRVIVNGRNVVESGDVNHKAKRGRIALPAYTGGFGECEVLYSNVVVTQLAPTH